MLENRTCKMQYICSFVTTLLTSQMHSPLHRQITLGNKLCCTCHASCQFTKLLAACWLSGNTFIVFVPFALSGLLVHVNLPRLLRGRDLAALLQLNHLFCAFQNSYSILDMNELMPCTSMKQNYVICCSCECACT